MFGKLRTIGRKAIAKHRALTRAERAAQDAVNSLVVVGATLMIGIFVMGSIGSAIPDQNMFSNATDQVVNVIGSSFELAAILPLVIIAAGLLFYVRRFGGGGGGRR